MRQRRRESRAGRATTARRQGGRRVIPKGPAVPASAAAELREILKFQEHSAAAIRTVRLPRATEPSFIYRPW